jgi:hypothetical protein
MTKKNKTILIAAVVLAAGAAVAVPMAVKHYSRPNFAKMTPRQMREYFDSNEFRDANENVRREIRGQMREAMQERMEARVNGYFALSEGAERTAYLDNIIDEMQARRAEFMAGRDPNRPPDANAPPGFGPPPFAEGFRRDQPDANRPGFGQRSANARQRPRINPERMRTRSERMSADSRVKMMQFTRDLRARMEQRGIQGPMMGRGGPGGPGGFGPGRGFGPPD